MESIKTINFAEVETYNDGNTIVWTGLKLDGEDGEKLKKDMTEFFTQEGFFLNGTEITEIFKIGGNVKGKRGRQDALIVLSKFDVSPLKRLMFDGLKWTEDFIVNYAKDYGVEPEEDWEDDE